MYQRNKKKKKQLVSELIMKADVDYTDQSLDNESGFHVTIVCFLRCKMSFHVVFNRKKEKTHCDMNHIVSLKVNMEHVPSSLCM